MLEIAGGILIAVAILVALPWILVGAYWAVVVGIGLAIVVGAWFALAAVVGEGWAWGISIAAGLIWLGWTNDQQPADDAMESNAGKFRNGLGERRN